MDISQSMNSLIMNCVARLYNFLIIPKAEFLFAWEAVDTG
jgi:hypothetical protein